MTEVSSDKPALQVQVQKSKRSLPEAAKPHRFVKGQSGNPSGAKKGSKHTATIFKEITEQLQAAIGKVEKEKNKSLLAHFVERAFEDDKVLIALSKKILPDLIRTEGDDRAGTRVYIIQPVNKDGKSLQEIKIVKRASVGNLVTNGNGASHK